MDERFYAKKNISIIFIPFISGLKVDIIIENTINLFMFLD